MPATMIDAAGLLATFTTRLHRHLAHRLREIRAASVALARPLSPEDAQVQSMPDASPIKWHLAHTTWFFETLVLERFEPGFRPFEPAFRVLFNSYYQGVGAQHPRPQRGLLTRPSLAQVMDWRAQVDARLQQLLAGSDLAPEALWLLELGMHHEQQHQELMLTDLLHLLSCNPLAPVYDAQHAAPPPAGRPLAWVGFDGGLVDIGHGEDTFGFDNEGPQHRRYLQGFALASRLVTQGEWLAFVEAGAYREPRWWLSAGWDWVRTQGIEAPAYWRREGASWHAFGLGGLQPLQDAAAVRHISFYEAEAYARWAGARLPTEAEWEHAARSQPEAFEQLDDSAWQWTRSAYEPYPGYQPWDGAVGEYNGKFMADQWVLRGGSSATPRSHVRPSYRNFFPAPTRWQFSGLRLARDA